MTDCNDVPAPSQPIFSPDELTLYGVPLATIKLDLTQSGGQQEINLPTPSNTSTTVAVAAYGYAYEGHCYRFDQIKIIVFGGGAGEDAQGCGFDKGYKMWRLKANARIVELSTSAGTVQELVLDAGLPGRRAPVTYRAEQMLIHRGGRLTTP
jgi:hypothetical protein